MGGETVLVIDDSPTILKVVQLVLTRSGFQVKTAPDGEIGVSLAREHRPDLILLDFVMPKMNGYQVCRALAAEEGLKDVPVVLMSAKGNQINERFVKIIGIVDYITKPFSPEAITAVVSHTISKYAREGSAAGGGGDGGLVPGAADVEPGSPQAARENAARHDALEAARDALAEAVAGRVAMLAAALDAGPALEEAAIHRAAREALDEETLLAAVRPIAGMTDDSAAALTGDLQVVPIAEVLQLLQVQTQSGILSVGRAKGRVDVFFRSGTVDLATAVGVSEEFLLGRFILDGNLVAKADFDQFLKSRGTTTKLLGQQLMKLGFLTDADLKQVLQRQTSELIYEILRWNFGRFTFRATRDLPHAAVDGALGLSVDGILMEGFRRVDEWHLIEREIENFDLVFLRNEDALAQMGRGRLTREELTVLELVNGKNTVKEIIRQCKMGSFDVSKMLYRLLSIKLIRRRVMPVAV